MPINPTYPGTYIQEIASGVRTVTGVATSITAFLGRARRGPLEEPTLINSYADFERNFGGLWEKSPMSYAVRDYYQNGGSQAVIVRLGKNATKATVTVSVSSANKTDIEAAIDAVKTAAGTAASAGGATSASVAAAARTSANSYNVNQSNALAKAMFTCADAVARAAEKIVGSGDAGATKDAADAAAAALKAFATQLLFDAVSEGEWGKNLQITVTPGDTVFTLTVVDAGSGLTEIIRNVSYKRDDPRRIDKVLELESQLIRVRFPQSFVDLTEDGIACFASISPPTVSVSVGSDGNAIDATSILGTDFATNKKGLYALEKADTFNLLCIPPYDYGATTTTGVGADVWEAAAKYCADRRALLLVDAPTGSTVAGITPTSLVGANKQNAALFFPFIRSLDVNGQRRDFAPSGAVAGVIARTDAQRGVWKAPAGLDALLSGAPELSLPLTDGEIGQLNQIAVNCLRTLPNVGRVIWGARTLAGNDSTPNDWKYIPVRRTALFIEESLFRGTQWVVFEPNDEPLWSQIRLNVGAFMHNLFRQGAFQGQTPREAYFVKCDKDTTTQNDINQGIVNIMVGFAPLKPAEFVIITLQQMAGQIAA